MKSSEHSLNVVFAGFQMTGFAGFQDTDPFLEKESGLYRMSNISLPYGPLLDRSSGIIILKIM